MPNDTVTVKVDRDAPGTFSKLFGIDSVNVHATAKARAGGLQSAKWVAPIAVNIKHPDLNCSVSNGSRSRASATATQIDLEHLHGPGSGNAAGSFSLINLEMDDTGGPGGIDRRRLDPARLRPVHASSELYNSGPVVRCSTSRT